MKKRMKTVGVKELKNSLSAYLRDVRSGATVLVTDRNDIVAELHEPYVRTGLSGSVNPLLLSWAETGALTLATCSKEPLPVSPIKNASGTSKLLLNSDRKESAD
jgi:hypothetical protein